MPSLTTAGAPHAGPDDAAGPAVLAVTAWSVTSALGVGADAFVEGLRASRRGFVPLDARMWPGTHPRAGLVVGFTPAGALGRRGTRAMDRATGLAVATVGDLLDRQPDARSAPDLGLVLGTANGSVASMMGFTRDSLTQERPYLVDPARFPNTVMNCAAGQCAIWHGLGGPNTTVAGGQLTGLLALSYARRLARCGHVDTVLCGAVEEHSIERAWLDWHARGARDADHPLGEGCAVFLLESPATARAAGRTVLAEIRALEFAAPGPHDAPHEALAASLRRALGAAGARPEDVWAVAPGRSGGDERAALRAVLGDAERMTITCLDAVGDTGAASAAFQLAGVLAAAQHTPAARIRLAVLTSADRDHGLGCAVVALPGREAAR